MIVTITGINGFIGSHLAARYVADGHEVRGIDRRRADGVDTTVIGDIRAKSTALLNMVEPGSVLIHLAARLGPEAVVADPLALLKEHEETTRAVCAIARERNATLILASTSEIYGWNSQTPFSEDDPTTIGPSSMPRTSYAVSKLHSEHVALAYGRQYGMRVIVPRFFNVCGPGQRLGFVMPNFAHAALSGKPLIVHGRGMAQRSLMHVADCVEALTRLVEVAPRVEPQVVNVGTNRPMRVVDLAGMVGAYVLRKWGIKAEIVMKPYEQTGDAAWGNMAVRDPDTTRLRSLIGEWGLRRVEQIVADVCDEMAERLGAESGG